MGSKIKFSVFNENYGVCRIRVVNRGFVTTVEVIG